MTPEHGSISTSNLELITRIPVAQSDFPIDYHSKILSLGSCFAVNMAEKFGYYQFNHNVNPFGILFHAPAIENLIRFSVDGKAFSEADIFSVNERWHCFDAHSQISHQDKNKLLQNLNDATAKAKSNLTDATHVIITLGTAWVYRHAESGNLVANCHKVPQREFSKELLSVADISQSLRNTIQSIVKVNPSAKIILTVSPVRHIKDGFPENQRSKSHLITAIHQVLDEQSNGQRPTTVDYFPSYEIMMDELRDYRFYADDLLHPSAMAVNYIWEKFAAAWISPDALPVMAEVERIRKALAHRPFNPDSAAFRKLIAAANASIESLHERFPHISLP